MTDESPSSAPEAQPAVSASTDLATPGTGTAIALWSEAQEQTYDRLSFRASMALFYKIASGAVTAVSGATAVIGLIGGAYEMAGLGLAVTAVSAGAYVFNHGVRKKRLADYESLAQQRRKIYWEPQIRHEQERRQRIIDAAKNKVTTMLETLPDGLEASGTINDPDDGRKFKLRVYPPKVDYDQTPPQKCYPVKLFGLGHWDNEWPFASFIHEVPLTPQPAIGLIRHAPGQLLLPLPTSRPERAPARPLTESTADPGNPAP